MEFGKNIKENVRDRLAAIDLIAQGAEKDVEVFVQHMKRMEPLQALVDLAKEKGDGSLSFLEKQIEISRRWLRR